MHVFTSWLLFVGLISNARFFFCQELKSDLCATRCAGVRPCGRAFPHAPCCCQHLKMLIRAAGAASLWFLSLGWRWSPHGSELQWEALAVGEISIKIARATKASGNPLRKRSRNPPPGSTCKSVRLQERVGWGGGVGAALTSRIASLRLELNAALNLY